MALRKYVEKVNLHVLTQVLQWFGLALDAAKSGSMRDAEADILALGSREIKGTILKS